MFPNDSRALLLALSMDLSDLIGSFVPVEICGHRHNRKAAKMDENSKALSDRKIPQKFIASNSRKFVHFLPFIQN